MTDGVLPERVLELLAGAWIVRVATVSPSGAPSVAPFWLHWDGERIVLDTLENATVRNLRREPRVAVLVDRGGRFEELEAATIDGFAHVYGPEQAPAAVVAGVEAIRARHADELATPAFEAYAERETQASAYVEILPERARYWSGR
jgi:hypothetical protein